MMQTVQLELAPRTAGSLRTDRRKLGETPAQGVRRGEHGRRPDAEHPTDELVWGDLGAAWVRSTKGSGSIPASARSSAPPEHRAEDQLARCETVRAPWGGRLFRRPSAARTVSPAPRQTAPRAGDGPAALAPRARGPAFSARPTRRKLVLPGSPTRSASGHRRPPGRGTGSRGSAFSRHSGSTRSTSCPSVLVRRSSSCRRPSSDRVPADPDRYNADVASPTGRRVTTTKEEAIRPSRRRRWRSRERAFYTMTRATGRNSRPPRRGKAAARPTPATRRLTPLPAPDVTVANGPSWRRLRRLDGRRAARIDERLARLVVPAGGNSFVRAEGLSTALELRPTPARPGDRRLHEHRDRVVYSTTERVPTRTLRARSTRAGAPTSASQPGTSSGARARPFLDLRVDLHVRAALRRPHLLRRAVHRDRAQLRRAPLPAAPALDLILPYASRRSCRCSSGAGS